MRKPVIIAITLLIAGLTVLSASAYSFPSALSALNTPTMTSSLGSIGMPASSLQVSQPTTVFGGNGWSLNDMQFFQPSKATTSGSGTGGIPASDVSSILQMLSALPTQDQMQQATKATPTPTPAAAAFTGVSSEVPSDQFIFIEVAKNLVYVDATKSGFKVPNVTMNYQYDIKNKKLTLKNRSGLDYGGAKVIVGYNRQNDEDGTYLFDYGIGSVPYDDIPIVFTGYDGRVSIMLNGTQKDLMPDKNAEVTTRNGNMMTTITVTNYGLVPKSNIQVKDKI